MERAQCGILMHVTSLPGNTGIGTIGARARDFVDFLQTAGQKYWQVLPLGQTSFGDSPYQSPSAFAGNPYLIDLETLVEEGLLEQCDLAGDWGQNAESVDYLALYRRRIPVLQKAYRNFISAGGKDRADFAAFCKRSAGWLDGYALFMSLKAVNGERSWEFWEQDWRKKRKDLIESFAAENAESLDFWKFIQYEFYSQWGALRAYANGKGIKIIGDMPIYVAYDSVDVWSEPENFLLDGDLKMVDVAGVPPDAFTEAGQLWGNPLYRWDALKADGYRWWVRRIRAAMEMYDVVRIDHFRGFESYYTVPGKDTDAKRGEWRKGPGFDLFETLNREVPEACIIAEDLGYLDDSVREMVDKTGYPGMKILQFAFGSGPSNEYLPHHYPQNCIAYTGTHDNETTLGWWKNLPGKVRRFAKRYLKPGLFRSPVDAMISSLMESNADTVVIPMQDYLHLGSGARMNVPSTIGGNWCWRMRDGMFNERTAMRIRKICSLRTQQRK